MALIDQLVSYWTLDEASGQRNDSHGANHLADNNGVGSEPGALNLAALFDHTNSEFLSVSHNGSLAFTTGFAVSLRLKRTVLALNVCAVGKWTYASDGGFAIQSDNTGDGSDMIVFIANALTDSGENWARFDTNQAAGAYYHVVVVFDGTQTGNANRLKLYQNGVEISGIFTGTMPASVTSNTAPFKLGSFGGALPRYWPGAIDEVALWSRALSAAEVTELWNGGDVLPYSSFAGSETVQNRDVLAGGEFHYDPGAGGARIPRPRPRTIDWNATHVLHPERGRQLLEVLSNAEVLELIAAAVGGIGPAVGMVPVGGIVPWCKSLPKCPLLPGQFVECNGQLLIDRESPFHEQTLPNLNSGTFLRGAAASGGTGGASTHHHTFNGFETGGPSNVTTVDVTNPTVDVASNTHGHQLFGDTEEVSHVPPYFEVVWVIRIK